MTFAIVLDEVLLKVTTHKTLQLTHAHKLTVMKLFGKKLYRRSNPSAPLARNFADHERARTIYRFRFPKRG
jgi:hypothetical protein